MNHKIPLILVPGLLCTAELWRNQIEDLSDIANITVAEHYLDDNIPDIAHRILRDAPAQFAVAGLSMGGYIVMEMWRQAADRISHLSLMDTTVDEDTPQIRARRIDFLKLAEIGSFRGVTKQLLPQLIDESRLCDEDLTARIYKMSEDIGKDGFIRQEKAILSRRGSWDDLENIDCPTLVLAGENDALIPASRQREIAGQIPGAVFKLIKGSGHLPTMEAPDDVTAAMRYWLMS